MRELLKLTAQPGMISFAGGLPAAELFPVDQVRQAADAVLTRIGGQALQYGETEGVAGLRAWVAGQLSRPGLEVRRANVLIVSGAQQALDMLGRVFLDEGDRAVVENPTYLALLSAWRPLGVQFMPVPSDSDGMRVDELSPLLARRPKLIYTVPNFQNPQGTTLSLERRKQLVEMLRTHDACLVEDNPYGELRFEGSSLPYLLELDAAPEKSGTLGRRVIYVGTFSKALVPGFRVGWVVAPEEVIEKLVQAKQAMDLHTSTFVQHLALELVRAGVLDAQIPRLREAYRERRDAMLAALERHFPEEATWTHPNGGMFLMATLPDGLNASDVLKQALQRQVAFVPGDDFHLNGTGQNTLRLNFSYAEPALIEEGVKRLGKVLKQMLVSPSAHG